MLTPEILASSKLRAAPRCSWRASGRLRDDAHHRQMGRALAQSAQHQRSALWAGLTLLPGRPLPGQHAGRRLANLLLGTPPGAAAQRQRSTQVTCRPGLWARSNELGARLPAQCGPAVAPALLHGDAHKNNCLATPAARSSSTRPSTTVTPKWTCPTSTSLSRCPTKSSPAMPRLRRLILVSGDASCGDCRPCLPWSNSSRGSIWTNSTLFRATSPLTVNSADV